jgi:hypothetical protein
MFGKLQIRSILISAVIVFLPLISNTGSNGTGVVTPATSATSACGPLTGFALENFSSPLKIDNQFYPLVPGTQFTLDGVVDVNGVSTSHRVVLTVTDLAKEINGVLTRVLWDTDITGGELVESELAFQAQDQSGNVWVLGEYPEDYEGGVFVGAPDTWISGIDSAKPGVLVPGNPVVGTPSFQEGKSPNIKFWDCGQVSTTNSTICNSTNCYQNVLTINEWGPYDPAGGIQIKLYAPGIGNFKISAYNDPEGETLQLTKLVHLNSRALLSVRNQALALDQRGYEVSKIYSHTSPAVVMP